MGQREGYLMIDHRASPGIPEDVAIKAGLDPKLVGEGKLLEYPTLTCSHCKVVVVKNPLRTRERANCVKCGNHYICDGCEAQARAPGYSHLPYDKLRDETLELGQKGIVLGSPQDLMR